MYTTYDDALTGAASTYGIYMGEAKLIYMGVSMWLSIIGRQQYADAGEIVAYFAFVQDKGATLLLDSAQYGCPSWTKQELSLHSLRSYVPAERALGLPCPDGQTSFSLLSSGVHNGCGLEPWRISPSVVPRACSSDAL